MRMIPDTPHGTRSDAEKRVFDRLRQADLPGEDDAWVAYHSLHLTRHAYKRFGEIDFLIVGPDGLFVLEVKGGGVFLREGLWGFTDRFGNTHEKAEGPFKQAESAMFGLIEKLEEILGGSAIESIVTGYGVVFPDCGWTTVGVEWDQELLADARSFRDFEGWLRRLIAYWKARNRHRSTMDSRMLRNVKKAIRPKFETALPLHVESTKSEERIVSLTEDQMRLVDVLAANPRILCSGGAGTGKTFLAMELARRWIARGLSVGLVCRSGWLKRYLESRFAVPGLVISLVDSIGVSLKRANVERFDALIVDEGQDLFDMASLAMLDGALDGDLRRGRWCIFHDVNNQAGLFGRYDQEAYDYLASMNPVSVPLTTNCRNTRIILDMVKRSLHADMGVRGAGDGPKVRIHPFTSEVDAVERLANELREIVEEGRVHPGNVTILSPRPFEQSLAARLPDQVRRKIAVLDEFSFRSFPPNRTSFAEISCFKGLENEAIIAIDLEREPKGEKELASSYVAMSRARSILSVIYK